MHLLLLATLALAGPDTGDDYCETATVFEGTWTGTGCLTPDVADLCGMVWSEPGCPSRDDLVALDRWSLWTCSDGGTVASGTTMPGAITELKFAPDGALAAAEIRGDWSNWTPGCCEGFETRNLQYGAVFECASPTAYVAPAADSSVDPLPAEPDTATGCGCDQATTGSVWWLLPVVAFRRRARRVAR